MSDRLTVYVFGASGHGKVVAEAVLSDTVFSLGGFIDDDPGKKGMILVGHHVVGTLRDLESLDRKARIVPAIGRNDARLAVTDRLLDLGWGIATVVHRSAVVASTATLGVGTYVGPLAVIHADAQVGRACIVNSGAIVEHDNRLGDGVHISPNAALGGGVTVGVGTHVGLGAVVLPGLSIGQWATVGAGAVVTRSLPGEVVAVGIPARVARGDV